MDVIVIEPHVSAYPNPISFAKGNEIVLGRIDTEYPGWIWSRTPDGNEGWAPLAYLDIDSSGNKGIALKDYCAYELTTNLDERLEVIEALNGWYLAKRLDGTLGWVPAEKVAPA